MKGAGKVKRQLDSVNERADNALRKLDAPVTARPTVETVLWEEVAMLREQVALYKATLDSYQTLLKLHEQRAAQHAKEHARFKGAIEEVASLRDPLWNSPNAKIDGCVAVTAVLIALEALDRRLLP